MILFIIVSGLFQGYNYFRIIIIIIQQRSLSRAARTDENSEQKGNRDITYWLGSLRNR